MRGVRTDPIFCSPANKFVVSRNLLSLPLNWPNEQPRGAPTRFKVCRKGRRRRRRIELFMHYYYLLWRGEKRERGTFLRAFNLHTLSYGARFSPLGRVVCLQNTNTNTLFQSYRSFGITRGANLKKNKKKTHFFFFTFFFLKNIDLCPALLLHRGGGKLIWESFKYIYIHVQSNEQGSWLGI